MPQSSFKDFLFALRNDLIAKGDYLSELTDHPGEKGRANESHLVDFLKEFLPRKYKIGTGFIEAVDDNGGRLISSQNDIILYDDSSDSPLYIANHWGVFPIEIVHGVIEVKTTLRKGGYTADRITELYKSFLNNRNLREYSKYKTYLQRKDADVGEGKKIIAYDSVRMELPPRFFMFAYDIEGFADLNALEKCIRDEVCNIPECDTHYHGIYILKKNWFIARRAHKNHETVKLEGDNAWLVFLNQFNLVLEDVVPANLKVDKTRYISGLNRTIEMWAGGSPDELLRDEEK